MSVVAVGPCLATFYRAFRQVSNMTSGDGRQVATGKLQMVHQDVAIAATFEGEFSRNLES